MVPVSRGGQTAAPVSRGGRAAVPVSRGGQTEVQFSRGGQTAVPVSRNGHTEVPVRAGETGGPVPSGPRKFHLLGGTEGDLIFLKVGPFD